MLVQQGAKAAVQHRRGKADSMQHEPHGGCTKADNIPFQRQRALLEDSIVVGSSGKRLHWQRLILSGVWEYKSTCIMSYL